MRAGKLTPQELDEIVFRRLPPQGQNVICGPGNGLDCAALAYRQNSKLVMSSDPITGAGKDIGRLAVHISCNDLAAFGVKPEALMLVLIAPPSATKTEIIDVMDQAAAACIELNTSIAGGHTEISDAVNRILLTATAVGFCSEELIKSSGAKPGDSLIMTKTAGLEGTAIIASDFADKLQGTLTEAEIETASRYIEKISVVPEGLCGRKSAVNAMHDATEGGILGAAWEMAEAAGLGIRLEQDLIPVDPLTNKICRHLHIDPYRLISSGSMLIATNTPDRILAELVSEKIDAAIVGRFTDEINERIVIADENCYDLLQPDRDELYKLM